jgi:hypothetical protein
MGPKGVPDTEMDRPIDRRSQHLNSTQILHKAVLHCKLFPACNRFSTEQFCTIKSFSFCGPLSYTYFLSN